MVKYKVRLSLQLRKERERYIYTHIYTYIYIYILVKSVEQAVKERESKEIIVCDVVLNLHSSASFFSQILSSDNRNVSIYSLQNQFSCFICCFVMCQVECKI